MSRSGGIGRRAGLKIPSWQQGEGSTPSFGSDTIIYYLFATKGESSRSRLMMGGIFSMV